MFLILIAGALVVGIAVLGLSMFRVAALSDRNSQRALTEWIAASHPDDRQVVPTDRAGAQFLLGPLGESSRAAG